MHTIVVQMSTDPARPEEVARHLREDVARWARQQPGFVNGQWLHGADRRQGISIAVFASEEAAISAARGPRSYPRDGNRAWNIESVIVYEQLTSAWPANKLPCVPRPGVVGLPSRWWKTMSLCGMTGSARHDRHDSAAGYRRHWG